MKVRVAAIFTDKIIRRMELLLFLSAICLINIPLLWGERFSNFAFVPSYVADGEWWRVITYSFAHVSWYHLFIDAGAFMLLYCGLLEPSWLKRILYVVFCALGSLAAAMLSPDIFSGGLCGLSGAAHGLMAVSALEIISHNTADDNMRFVGVVGLWIVVVKSIVEVVTGKVVFSFLHIGDVGTPLTLCHGGGVLAGIIVFVLLHELSKK